MQVSEIYSHIHIEKGSEKSFGVVFQLYFLFAMQITPVILSGGSSTRLGPCLVNNTQPMLSHINVGTGKDVTIREMAETIKLVVGYEGKLTFDATKPDGTLRKLIDVTRLTNMGWKYSVDLKAGLQKTCKWYLKENRL